MIYRCCAELSSVYAAFVIIKIITNCKSYNKGLNEQSCFKWGIVRSDRFKGRISSVKHSIHCSKIGTTICINSSIRRVWVVCLKNCSVCSQELQCIQLPATIATKLFWVTRNNMLFRKFVKSTCLYSVSWFNTSNNSERITAPTCALILYWINNCPVSPIHACRICSIFRNNSCWRVRTLKTNCLVGYRTNFKWTSNAVLPISLI
jgi:hypothetical protein